MACAWLQGSQEGAHSSEGQSLQDCIKGLLGRGRGSHDHVAGLDLRIPGLAAANIGDIELGGGTLAVRLPEDDYRGIGNIVEAFTRGDNLKKSGLTADWINAGLLH